MSGIVPVTEYVYAGLQSGHVVEIVPDGRLRVILRMSTKECGNDPNFLFFLLLSFFLSFFLFLSCVNFNRL